MNDQEPLVMTLEDAIGWITASGKWLGRVDRGKWVVAYIDSYGLVNLASTGYTWSEAVSAALGRKVVERDDQAELVKALRHARNQIRHPDELIDLALASVGEL